MSYKEYNNGIVRFPTHCCALTQLAISDYHTINEIEAIVNQIKKETEKKWNPNNRDGGERAIFVITTPDESKLASNLAELGFKEITHFNRRNGYATGILTMWFLSW